MRLTEVKTIGDEKSVHTWYDLTLRQCAEHKDMFRALGYTNVIQEDADVWMFDYGSVFGQYEFRR